MTKSSLNKLMLTASSLGIISLIAVPQASAGTITITPEGTIYIQETPRVLGEATDSQTDAVESAMQAESDVLLEQYRGKKISYSELKAGKTAIAERYKAKQLEEAAKTAVVNEAKKVEVKSTQGNKVRVQTVPTELTVAAPLAEEDEVVFVQKVATSEAKTRIMSKDQSKYMITNGIAAKVGTPLSFNLETNEMTVTTPNGTKVVAILPDAALQQARLGAMIEVADIPTATDSADVNVEESPITLMDYQNSPTYAVKGKAKKNLFGFIPVELDKTVYVSAVSGNVVDTYQSPFDRFLDLVSF
jgi:hypothetical protein